MEFLEEGAAPRVTLTATDGHALVSRVIYLEEGETGAKVSFPPGALAEAAKRANGTAAILEIDPEAKVCRVDPGSRKGQESGLSFPLPEVQGFPDFRAVIPSFEGQQVYRLALNPWLLARAAEAMGLQEGDPITLEWVAGRNRHGHLFEDGRPMSAIRVEGTRIGSTHDLAHAVIMPCRIESPED